MVSFATVLFDFFPLQLYDYNVLLFNCHRWLLHSIAVKSYSQGRYYVDNLDSHCLFHSRWLDVLYACNGWMDWPMVASYTYHTIKMQKKGRIYFGLTSLTKQMRWRCPVRANVIAPS
jgi:hypothetical protein